MKRVALILLALCASLNAATYYVTKTGNDSHTGLGASDALAWGTCYKGLTTAVAGDTVFIGAGVWDENGPTTISLWAGSWNGGFTPTHAGTAGNEIVFKGYLARPVILGRSSFNASTIPSTNRAGAAFEDGAHYIVFDSLEFKKGRVGIWFAGEGSDVHDITIRNCKIDSTLGPHSDIDDNSGAFLTYQDSYRSDHTDGTPAVRNILIENCEIFANGAYTNSGDSSYTQAGNTSGFHLYGCDSCIIRNNIIHDVEAGIHMKHSARFTEVYGNTIYNCGVAMWDRHTGNYSSLGYGGSYIVGTNWHHNISYNNELCFALSIGGTTAATQKDSCTYFWNNTCDCDSAKYTGNPPYGFQGGIVSGTGYAQYSYFFNNIIVDVDSVTNDGQDSRGGFSWSNNTVNPTGVYEDYNMYSGKAATSNYFNWHGTLYTITTWRGNDLSALLGGSGRGTAGQNGTHDSIAEPLFADEGGRDYTLSESSPARTGGKGGTFTFYPGTDAETTMAIPTYLGALDPGLAITDTCIQITGKTSLGYSDTCYCIVDSLVYNFTNRDTVINTNGKDNIRIWGYHNGGGRAIIRYNLDDAGSLSWHSDSSKSAPVFYVNGTDGGKINNIAIVPGTVDDSVWQFNPFTLLTSKDIEITACSTITAGFSSRTIKSESTGGSPSYNLWIHNNNFQTISKGLNRRDQMYGACIHLEGGLKSATGYNYLARVSNNIIGSIHTGIAITGGTKYPIFYVDTNTVTVDARDDLHMTYDDNDVNNSVGDPYGLNVDGSDSLSHVFGNTFHSGSSYYGGDAMLLQHINASATDRFEVAYNSMPDGRHGNHPRIAIGRQAWVFAYVRNYDASLWVKGLWLHHNSAYAVVDEDTSTHSIGSYAEGVRMGFENGANGNLVENNHITIIPTDSLSRTGAGALEVSGLTFEQHDSTQSGDGGTGDNIARNNYWRVPRNPIWLGGTRIGIGADNVEIIGDTCNTIYDGDSTFVRFHQSATYYSHSIGNKLQDMILQGYANQADVIKGTVTTSADSLGKQLSYLRSLTVNFKNASSANINGGTIWAVDAYGHRHDMPNSNASGNSSDTLRWRFFGYDAMTGDGYAVQDSNAYNNFTFWGKSGSDSASTAATINWTTSQLINVQLSGETTPPAAIKTLRGLTLKGVTIK